MRSSPIESPACRRRPRAAAVRVMPLAAAAVAVRVMPLAAAAVALLAAPAHAMTMQADDQLTAS